jgi:effector-binding domain-containing protein
MSYEPRIETREPTPTAVVRVTVPMASIAETLGSIFNEVIEHLGRTGGTPVEAFARYTIHEGGADADIEAGFTASGPVRPEGRIEAGTLPGGEVATVMHVGAYDQVGEAYQAVEAWLNEQGRVTVERPWEVYLSMPDEVPPRTRVDFPIGPAPATA